MTTRPDDDALTWDGDDDPTLDTSDARGAATPEAAAPAAPAALPDGFTAVGKGAETVGHIDADGTIVMPGDRAPMSNGALVTMGILGGIYAIYTIGWVVAGERLRVVARLLVAEWAYLPAFWCAVIAPLAWFGATFVATRDAKTWVRMAWLIAGVVLLVPWPFVLVGAVGQ